MKSENIDGFAVHALDRTKGYGKISLLIQPGP